MSGLPGGLPPNPLNASLFTGNGVGPMGLNPAAAQAAQNAALTQQGQNSANSMANLLQQQGQTPGKNYTSPWQVAGQMAQALRGRMMRNQANQGQAQMNAPFGQPGGAAAPVMPGQSPAAPSAPAGGAVPWSGAPQGPGAQPAAAAQPMPAPQQPPIPPNLAGPGIDLSDMFG